MAVSYDTRISRLEQELQQLKASASLKPVFLDPINNLANAVPGDGSVTAAKIADGSVTAPKIAALAVGAAAIADLAVTAGKIADATITNAKIADATIQSAKIATLAADKIVAGAGIITNLTIEAVLTIGAAGSIVDADGSVWNQAGITLSATTVAQDMIAIRNPSFFHKLGIVSYIQTGNINTRLEASYWSTGIGEDRGAYVGALATATEARARMGAQHNGTHIAQFELDAVSSEFTVFGSGGALPNSGYRFSFGSLPGTPASYGNGYNVIHIANANAVPTANPPFGGILYVELGALKYRSQGGKTTILATNV